MLFNVFFIALIVFGILSLLTCTAFDANTQQETREFFFHSGVLLLMVGVFERSNLDF